MPVPVQTDTGAAKNIWVAAGEGDLDRVRHLVEVEGGYGHGRVAMALCRPR